MDSLSIECEREGDVPVIWLRGELDRLSAESLDAAVRDVAARECLKVVLDVGGLDFIDSAGLRCLTRADKLLRDAQRHLVVRSPSSSILRLFELVGLHEVLTVEAS